MKLSESLRTSQYRCIWVQFKVSIAAFGLLALLACVHTPPFLDAQGREIAGHVASMESVQIGGVAQHIWFRGLDARNPALILLHGGPGASEGALFRHFNASLEQHYLVVYWEQRGTGRSYHAGIPAQSMTIPQLLRDLDEVVDLIRARFHKQQVVLLGHSWGTVIGTLYASRHPEKVAAYVGVAQVTNTAQQRRMSFDFAMTEALRRDNASAAEELRAIGPSPRTVDDVLALGKWTERFGGAMRGGLSTGKLIWTALAADETNLIDLVKFGQGNRFSLLNLEDEIARLDLSGQVRQFKVPMFMLLGRHDWHVPAADAARYFELVEAPCKQLFWFEQSAHYPPFEEPDQFNRVMMDHVLPAVSRAPVSCTPKGRGTLPPGR